MGTSRGKLHGRAYEFCMEPGGGKPCHYARIAGNLLATSVVATQSPGLRPLRSLKPIAQTFGDKACHPERSEGSSSTDAEILRCAQDDSQSLPLSAAKGHHSSPRKSYLQTPTNHSLTPVGCTPATSINAPQWRTPPCYTPPSFSGFKSGGRDKLGAHEVFQQLLPPTRRTLPLSLSSAGLIRHSGYPGSDAQKR